MEQQENKIIPVIGIIVEIAIIGAIVCGLLECFDISTGVIGGVLAIIPILFMVGFVIWQIIREKNR